MGDDEERSDGVRARLGAGRVRARGAFGWIREHALGAYAAAAIAYMLIPIAVIVLFSFNDPTGNFNISWQGFTLDHWRDPFADQALTDALVTSLKLAALSTVIATAIGTLLALALVRHRFLGRRAANVLVLVPMATPEVVIGAALLSMFVYLDVARGFATLLIAHVMFSISFVVVVVRSRLIGFDPALEEAAADLGAGPLARFRTVTLPLLAPGVVAAAALAFALSIDDFVVSNFNSGTTVTFPLYIFGASQRGIPVEVNVLSTMLFALAAAALCLVLWQQRRAERLNRPLPEPEASGRSGGLRVRVVPGGDHPCGEQGAELARVEAQALVEDRDRVLAEALGGREPGGLNCLRGLRVRLTPSSSSTRPSSATCGSVTAAAAARTGATSTPSAFRRAVTSADGRPATAVAIAPSTRSRLPTRASLVAERGSARSSASPSASHRRSHIRSLIAPMTTNPSATSNAA